MYTESYINSDTEIEKREPMPRRRGYPRNTDEVHTFNTNIVLL